MSQPTNGEQLQLLRTKLYRPRPVGDLVHRTRLSELLDRYSDRAVTLICAPAGFGKTTLLSDWLENCDCPSAWLSLDKSDGELPVFLTYFVAAIRTLFPTACANTLALLEAAVLPPLTSLVTAIVNDLDSLADDAGPDSPLPPGRRFVLVLDDYHLIREPAINGLLAQLMRFPPRTLHLILSARQDPPFLEHQQPRPGGFQRDSRRRVALHARRGWLAARAIPAALPGYEDRGGPGRLHRGLGHRPPADRADA